MTDIRNIAIIAHVDHGKTTLIDSLFQQSGSFRDNQQMGERIMDSNDLERERGITILAKCTSIKWQESKINIIDTPGHADFGGEVERVLSMADGVLLLVDSSEGPMPQTKFVLTKALALGLKPIVVINKIDKPDSRADEVLDEVFDLFVSLNANDQQLDFPTLYASGRDGWCVRDLEDERKDLTPLLGAVLEYVSPPQVDKEAPFSMLATILQADPYLGPVLIGKVYSGVAKINMPVHAIDLNGKEVEKGRLTKLQSFEGVSRVPIEEAQAGDIIAIAGMVKSGVSDTIADISVTEPIYSTPVDPPTIAITISVNDSPFAGQEGTKVTSRMIADRLTHEEAVNVAITVTETEKKDAFEVGGRGELQLGVLIETMRREGFELSVSKPRVLLQEIDGVLSEPLEEVTINVDDEYSGVVVEKLSKRKGELREMKPSEGGRTSIEFLIPARGLIGYQGEFMTDTRGTGLLNRLFHSYGKYRGPIENRRNGALISTGQGETVAYALFNLQERGMMFLNSGEKVYAGMVIGEHNRDNDLEVNILKGKQLTNMRASGKDEAVKVTAPKKMTLEEMISYIGDDELVEVTPESLRIRKKLLDPNARKRAERSGDKL
jgi:GTP-binding protein